MLKLLLIVGLTVYVLYKVGSFFYRVATIYYQFRHSDPKSFQGNGRNGSASANDKKRPSFKGGEYIDYEEVK